MALTTATPIQPLATEAREALATEIARLARRVLAEYGDTRLLNQPQAKTIAAVKQAVRDELSQAAPVMLTQVSRWRREQLLREHIGVEVRMHLGQALRRRAEAGDEAAQDVTFQLVEVLNGVEHYALESRAASTDQRGA